MLSKNEHRPATKATRCVVGGTERSLMKKHFQHPIERKQRDELSGPAGVSSSFKITFRITLVMMSRVAVKLHLSFVFSLPPTRNYDSQ